MASTPDVLQNQPVTPASEPAAAEPTPMPETMISAPQPNITAGNVPAYGEPGAAAEPSTVVPAGAPVAQPVQPPRHSALLAMVQGLSIGLSNFGKAAATGGREGGAAGVIADYGAIARQKQEAQAAAREMRSADIRDKYMTVETNRLQGENMKLMGTMHSDIQKADLEAQKAGVDVQASKVGLENARRESISQWGVDPLAAPGPAGAAQNVAGATKATQQLINFASDPRVLGPDHQAVKDATDALATAQQSGDVNAIIGATAGLRRAISFQQQAVESGIKQQTQAETAPLGAKADNYNAMALRWFQATNPGAKTLPPEYAVNANSTPADLKRIDAIMEKTGTAQMTQAQRDVANQMRKQMQDFQRGLSGGATGDLTKTGTDYLATLPPARAAEIKGIGEGRLGGLLAKSPAVLRSPAGIALLSDVAQAYPDFDTSKAAAYPDTYKDFTSGKTSVALQSGATAAKHLAELKKINDDNPVEARNPLSAAGKAFQNKLNTLAGELVKFYGMPDTDQSINSMKDTLGGVWNRDAAIQEQGKSMADKFQSFGQVWKNAAPSPAYEAPLPRIDASAVAAMATLDPNFAQKNPDLAKTGNIPAAAPAGGAAPTGATGKAKGSDGNWYYHDAQGNNLGKVQ